MGITVNVKTSEVVEVNVPGPRGPKGDKGDKGDSGSTAWVNITGKPTTLAGFGITDAASDAELATKEPTIAAGTTAQYWRGDKTWHDFATDVRATLLTGLSTAVSTAVSAGDTVLTAIGKLQAQLNLKAPLASPALTGTPTAPTATAGTSTGQISTTAFVQGEFTARMGVSSGIATLDSAGKVLTSQLPGLAINDTFTVASQAAMLALTAQRGDIAIRTDTSQTYVLSTDSPSTLADWKLLLNPSSSVTSVFSRTGAVSAANGDYNAGQITFTPTGAITSATVQAAIAELDTDKQASLGFTPVQQGTGTLQTTNAVKIGWSTGAKLRVQVDATDFGVVWPISISGDAATVGGTTLSTFGKSLVDDADATAARTTLGLGALATLNAVASATMPTGSVVDSVTASYAANADLTAIIPCDDTIPQNTEGTQILSASITPKSTTNKLRIRLSGMASLNQDDTIVWAIFSSASASALAAGGVVPGSSDWPIVVAGETEYTPGSTSAVTISVRVGPAGVATLRMNGSSTARFFGGVAATRLVIEEIKA